MKCIFKALPAMTLFLLLGAGCTERRTMSDPVPDGDTIEVVIQEPTKSKAGYPEVIEVPDSIDLTKR